MAESLIDFKGAADLALQAQHQATYEQNSLLQAEQNKIERQKLQETTDARRMKYFLDMSNDPMVRANPEMARTALAQSWVTAKAPGYEQPDVIKEMLNRGSDSMREMLGALHSGDPEKVADNMGELQIRMGAPYAEQLMKGQADAGKLAEQARSIEDLRQLQEARFTKIHDDEAKVRAGLGAYSQASREFSDILKGTDSPAFLKTMKAAQTIPPGSGLDPSSIATNLAKNHPEAAQFTAPQYTAASAAYSKIAAASLDQVNRAKQAIENMKTGAQLPPGVTERDLNEQINVGQTTMDAYNALSTWANDPFNQPKLKAAKAAQSIVEKRVAELSKLKDSTAQDRLGLLRDAQSFRQTEAGQKHLGEQAQNYGQSIYVDRLALGDNPLDAARRATMAASEKFGVLPDSGKFVNPGKKNTLAIDVNDPTTATRTNLQSHLTGLESTLNIIGNLKSAVQQSNIGLAAALKSTAYGFTSQIKGLAETVGSEAIQAKIADPANNKNFTPSKWFDPSLSTVDLLANTLAYRIINQEQGGRVSDKDFAEMKKRLNVDSWMAGKEDVVQRLSTMEKQLRFEQGVYRKIMPTFGKGPGAGSPPSTAAEYLQSIGIEGSP